MTAIRKRTRAQTAVRKEKRNQEQIQNELASKGIFVENEPSKRYRCRHCHGSWTRIFKAENHPCNIPNDPTGSPHDLNEDDHLNLLGRLSTHLQTADQFQLGSPTQAIVANPSTGHPGAPLLTDNSFRPCNCKLQFKSCSLHRP